MTAGISAAISTVMPGIFITLQEITFQEQCRYSVGNRLCNCKIFVTVLQIL